MATVVVVQSDEQAAMSASASAGVSGPAGNFRPLFAGACPRADPTSSANVQTHYGASWVARLGCAVVEAIGVGSHQWGHSQPGRWPQSPHRSSSCIGQAAFLVRLAASMIRAATTW